MHERAGHQATVFELINLAELLSDYFKIKPDVSDPAQQVVFGTSGHRGSSSSGSFNEMHIAAITQAIAEYRISKGLQGPVFVGHDTHALSGPAEITVLEVLAGNGLKPFVDSSRGFTPTPAVSVAIIDHNRGILPDSPAVSDGIVITPSHNPPQDGGIKYNALHGGPADTDITNWVAQRANELIADGNVDVKRGPSNSGSYDFRDHYITQLPQVIDLEAIASSGVSIGADPLGGSSVEYWSEIGDRFGLNLTVVNPEVDPRFGFMTLDWDGKIRMDCSSPYAMAKLIENRSAFDISTGNDADADRHGIVTRDHGLMNPNHFLAVAIEYLFTHRPQWPEHAAIGKTMVSSSMINRVAESLGRKLVEVPVGFKWFVPGLQDGSLGFGGEESAGASFLRRNGTTWSTDKDGIIMALLAAEIQAVTGESPSERYRKLAERFGEPAYRRVDAAASREQKQRLAKLNQSDMTAKELAGEAIELVETSASSGGALGGVKVTTKNAWFAARPSGTEDVYKIYGESFKGDAHLAEVLASAQELVDSVIGGK
jgi:phosphoglucomutase